MGKEAVGANYSKFFLRMHESRAYWCYDELDLHNIGKAYYKKIKNTRALNALRRKQAEAYFLARKKTGNSITKQLKSISFKNCIHLARLLEKELTMAIGTAHSVEGISWGSEIRLKALLEKRGRAAEKSLQLLSSPTYPSFLLQAQIALGAIKKEPEKNRDRMIKRFLHHFGWLDNSYVEGKMLSAHDVMKKVKALKHIPSLKELVATKRKKLQCIQELQLNTEELFVVETIALCTKWQDDRKKYLLQTIGRFEPVVIELSRRLGMTPEAFKYICPKELTQKNLSSKKFLAQLKKRYPGCAYYTLRDRALVYSGKEYRLIEKTLSKNTNSAVRELKGTIANKGRVRGRARICRTIHDIPKVKRGEILVAFMTRPEFLPAMQRAAAFVTNEGGVTSHAAIISREMGKPCIIGTKIATEVLHDGDMVEVDANHGVVRKLQ